MKNILWLSILLLATIIGCQQPNTEKKPLAEASTGYICPMNCEKGKTYDKPGTCPICHMDIEPVDAAVAANKAEYTVNFAANPAAIAAGQPATLAFTPKIKGNEAAAVPLDLVHEKKMHLILVSDDLSWFDHIHPEYQPDGGYQIKAIAKGAQFEKGRGHGETRFENGGQHWAFVDIKPTGGLNQVEKIDLDIAGTPSKPANFGQARLKTTVDGYDIVLDPHGEKLVAGKSGHLHVDIMQKGQRLTPDKIENYLGAKAHVIMVETATKAFIHTHPEAVGDELEMNTTFAEPGLYRCWLQFQTNGQVHTADFVIEVGKP